MIVCSCNKVTDTDIREAIEDGATSLKALRKQTGLGESCGSCLQGAKIILSNHSEDLLKARPDLYYGV